MHIKNLKIKSFRGIPGELEISLSDKNCRPTSVLIFGDNGSGKSSIVDALEFNLQGKIERTSSLHSEFKPSPFSYRNEELAGSVTEVIFSNGESFKREIKVSFDKTALRNHYEVSPIPFHPDFRIAPLALRRNDIISYASTPIQNKQALFLSFVYGTQKDSNSATDKDIEFTLEKERLFLKKKRRDLVAKLASILQIPTESIPLGKSNEFDQFIKIKVRKGLTPYQYNQLKKTGRISGIDDKAIEISNEIIEYSKEIGLFNKEIRRAKLGDGRENVKKQIRTFLIEASSYLTQAFNEISPVNFVKEIKLSVGALTEMSCEIQVVLKNGKITSPNKVFSEANLDLLILLLFTSLIRQSSKYGQGKVMVLDDVLQSVDSTMRLNFIEYLLKDFKDWQLIITAHDRLWLNQLRSVFRRCQKNFKEIEIMNWSFDHGPHLIEIGKNDGNALLDAFQTNNTQIIASQTGILMETLCHKLSMSLNISIQRRYEDKYTIGDLWPGIMKFFKKSRLGPLTQEIDKLLHIRNLLGAHYNEWATSLSNSEILSFAHLIADFHSAVFCNSCQDFLRKTGKCGCGEKSLEAIAPSAKG